MEEKEKLAKIQKILNNEFPELSDDERLTEKQQSILNDIYALVWMEAYYDPDCEATQKFALLIAPKMKELNEMLKFKR